MTTAALLMSCHSSFAALSGAYAGCSRNDEIGSSIGRKDTAAERIVFYSTSNDPKSSKAANNSSFNSNRNVSESSTKESKITDHR